MTAMLSALLAELRRRLKELYGPRLIQLVLFGSRARGDDEPGSDIDVLVVLCGTVSPAREIERTGGIIAELSLAHDEVISLVFTADDRFARRTGPLLRNIEREGIAL
ncbi:MAG: nucleotidyltransferase domain-containing protein [Acidobacteriota bacterium]